MYQVYNTQTNEAMPVLSDTPYELAGPLGERVEAQKRNEQGNLLYLKSIEKVVSNENGQVFGTGVFEYEETAEPTYTITITDYETGESTSSENPYPPVMVDAGPLYEWREIVPTLDDKKQPKIDEINSLCAKEITSGIYSDADGIMRKYDSDVVDQLNFMQAMEMSKISSPIPYRVWTADGTEKEWIQLSYAQFCKVLSDGALVKAQLLMKCSELKKRINDATNEDELDLIKWSD